MLYNWIDVYVPDYLWLKFNDLNLQGSEAANSEYESADDEELSVLNQSEVGVCFSQNYPLLYF